MGEFFDTAIFIEEIKKRPAIWDTTCKDYSNRDVKRNCWEEVGEIFCCQDEASDNEKKVNGVNLQRKWKSLRDCFARELNKVKKLKGSQAARRKNPYIYYKQLSFLHKVIQNKSTTTKAEEPEPQTPNDYEEDPSNKESDDEPLSKKRKNNFPVEQLINVLQRGIEERDKQSGVTEEDADRMFLLSLLQPLKRVPEHLRLDAKIELMQVINRHSQVQLDDQTNCEYTEEYLD